MEDKAIIWSEILNLMDKDGNIYLDELKEKFDITEEKLNEILSEIGEKNTRRWKNGRVDGLFLTIFYFNPSLLSCSIILLFNLNCGIGTQR